MMRTKAIKHRIYSLCGGSRYVLDCMNNRSWKIKNEAPLDECPPGRELVDINIGCILSGKGFLNSGVTNFVPI